MNEEPEENNECANILEDFDASLDLQVITLMMTRRAFELSEKRNVKEYVF
jgi:hypothetical protein